MLTQFSASSLAPDNQHFSCFRWFGIELDEPLGRHDGTVEEIRYFAAPDDHGVFVTDARLIKLHNQPPKPGQPKV